MRKLALAVVFGAACARLPVSPEPRDKVVFAGVPVELGDAGAPAGVSWELGDGATATGGLVRHAWLKPGVYEVKVSLGARSAKARVEVVRRPLFGVVPPAAQWAFAVDGAWRKLPGWFAMADRYVGEGAGDFANGLSQALGFDVRRPDPASAGLAADGGLAVFDAGEGSWLCVAVDDPQKARGLGERLFGDHEGHHPLREVAPGRFADERGKNAFLLDRGFLCGGSGGDVAKAMDAIAAAPPTGLAGDPALREVRAAVKGDAGFLFIARKGVDVLAEPEQGAKGALARVRRGAGPVGVAFTVAEGELRGDVYAALDADARAAAEDAVSSAAAPGAGYLARLPAGAVITVLLSLRPALAAELLAEAKGEAAQLEQIMTDLAPSWSGNAAFGFFLDPAAVYRGILASEGEGWPSDAFGFVAALELRDAARAREALDRTLGHAAGVDRTSDPRGGRVYRMSLGGGTSGGLALSGDALVLAAGPGDLVERAVANGRATAKLAAPGRGEQVVIADVARGLDAMRGDVQVPGADPMKLLFARALVHGYLEPFDPLDKVTLKLRLERGGVRGEATLKLRPRPQLGASEAR